MKLIKDNPTAIKTMIYFMYSFNYNNNNSERNQASPILSNIKIYQIRNKYNILKLKKQAKKKFIKIIKKRWEIDNFVITITNIYMTTVSTNQGLRDPHSVLSYIDNLLRNKDIKQVLQEVIYLTANLSQGQKNQTELKTYHYPSCSKG
ncbi:hypothetical protein BO83DRAFT_392173 [Aspergillus eucalypticola CBS 122712]|uniref:Uncharacterized protein n=1 Tax=Aspergillus eucalypticola (strain CBS 122712 / IBT 29274) TaxID=1448314 RepID=A0A317UWZ1_ASPEC|nr:uncharacterized protein BO83DRAFT_392173 [Aspergillus eucalypticola CBS 122712]PWY65548.1 hypothetical protein BO83DRAFT_392173 [Aspergillus eucalypticola CBS 122712]